MRKNLNFFCIMCLIASLSSCVSIKKLDDYDIAAEKLMGVEKINMTMCEKTENINGILPDTVYIKTSSQTFNKNYQFCLVDGKIYYKGRFPDLMPTDWEILDGCGLPYSKRNLYPTPKYIVAIAGDVDSLLAMSDNGKIYEYYFERTTIRRHITWYNRMGFPAKGQLDLDSTTGNARAWAVGTRRSEVLYYTDIFGNHHHYGSMGIETFYFLNDAGDSIRFTDSGLPADLSRTMLLPERGKFIARNISASGSTLMVINDAGEIYTRLIDYDTMGCDPMFFKYSYKNIKQNLEGSNYATNFNEWGLPAEDWAMQPSIPLSKNAKITKHITILQTGQGNAARELRIGGTNTEGKTGFYYKNIYDSEWNFKELPMNFSADSYLDTTMDKNLLRREAQEIAYSGNYGKYSVEVPNFVMSEGQCTIKLSYGCETAEITMHPVEMWTNTYRLDPGIDGTPKCFFITFSLDEIDNQNLSNGFKDEIKNIFSDKNLVLFSSRAEATQDYLHILIPDTPEGDITFLLKTENAKDINPESLKYTFIYQKPVIDLYMSQELTSQNALEKNREYLKLLKKGKKLGKSLNRSANITSGCYQLFDALTAVTHLNKLDYPKIKTVTMFGDRLVEENRLLYKQLKENHQLIYGHLEELVKARIANLENPTPYYRDTLQEYLDMAGLPLKAFTDVPYFPGIVLNTDDGRDVLVELINPVKRMTDYAKSDDKSCFKISVRMDGKPGKLTIKNGKLTITTYDSRCPVFSQDLL